MQVKQLMSTEVQSVRVDDSLDKVARVLWERDVGCVPVIDGQGRVAGMITDRDVCMAAFTTGRRLGELRVAAAMAARVHTVRAEEGLHAAETLMRGRQVRRLPVVDDQGCLVGMLSCNDIVRALADQNLNSSRQLDADHFVQTLAAISAPRQKGAAATRPAGARI